MEFWEGALVVVGGIWLIGRMSRRPQGPVYTAAPMMVSPSNDPSGGLNPTLATNTAGDSSLTVGEPLGQPATPLRPTRTPVSTRPCSTCYGNFPRPVAIGGGGNPTPFRGMVPTVPRFGTTPIRGAGATNVRATVPPTRPRFTT